MKIALAQYSVQRAEPAANFERIIQFLYEARAEDAVVLCLPEMCTTGFDWAKNRELLPTANSMLEKVRALARTHRIAICGSFLEQCESGEPANTFYFISDEGEVVARYRKIHLFTLFKEHQHMEAGNETVIADTVLGRIGCSVCYDLRFPELFRKNTLAGAGLHVLPAAFPHPRLEHWQTLIRARAIENQSFMIATNQCGFEGHGETVGKTQYFGHSIVVDPWGEIVFEADEDEGLYPVEIDLSKIEAVRNHLTALRDRRPELY